MYCQSIKCYDSSHCIIQRKYYFPIKYYYSKKYYYSNKCYYSNKYYENKRSIIKSEKYFCCFWRAIRSCVQVKSTVFSEPVFCDLFSFTSRAIVSDQSSTLS